MQLWCHHSGVTAHVHHSCLPAEILILTYSSQYNCSLFNIPTKTIGKEVTSWLFFFGGGDAHNTPKLSRICLLVVLTPCQLSRTTLATVSLEIHFLWNTPDREKLSQILLKRQSIQCLERLKSFNPKCILKLTSYSCFKSQCIPSYSLTENRLSYCLI